jgi:peptide/nickel transport system permease protein
MTDVIASTTEFAGIRRRNPLAEAWANLRRSWSGMLGLILIVVHIVVALSSPLWIPQDPLEMNSDIRSQAPSVEHLWGTDRLGRDVFSRSMLGGRVTMLVTLSAIVIAMY